VTVPARRAPRPLVPAPVHDALARCGACADFCRGAGDMLCSACLKLLPEWARALYMAAWRAWQAKQVGPERMVAVRARCIAAVIERRRAGFPVTEPSPRPVIVVARGKTRPAVLEFLAAHPGSTLQEIAGGAGTAYKPTSVLLSTLRREGRLGAERALGTTTHLRYTLKETAS
jgi:hypothetical protein